MPIIKESIDCIYSVNSVDNVCLQILCSVFKFYDIPLFTWWYTVVSVQILLICQQFRVC